MTAIPRKTRKVAVGAKPPSPSSAAIVSRSVAAAIKALARGDASSEQQRMALDWIIKDCASTYALPYHESSRDTDFALGKMWVGQQIVGVVNMSMLIFDETKG